MKTAYIFPGQGSQAVGMGKELAGAFVEARNVFAEVDDVLSQNLSKLMFEGPLDELTLTTNAQPAIMASSIAVWRVMQKQCGAKITNAAYVAGHSLGEYSALCAANTFSLADTARLLRIRGDAMQKAVPAGKGGMAAIIGLETEEIERACEKASDEGEICVLANYNAPGQIVISGHKAAVERACEFAREAGAKRALPLNVSAPFHSPLMQPAADKMREALDNVDMRDAEVPIFANVTADAVKEASIIKTLLIEQVTGSVRWSDSILAMHDSGVTHTLEIGTGKILSGLVKRTAKDIITDNVENPRDIESFAAAAA